MDIDLLSKMVKELILDEDRVVLPGLGCFVAEIVPASFSDKGYTINPPYRRLYFRSRPDEGDGLVETAFVLKVFLLDAVESGCGVLVLHTQHIRIICREQSLGFAFVNRFHDYIRGLVSLPAESIPT